ncbi:MAG: CotH kinase family protein [Planctomycetota bacterium]|nr:CotH kinase family protein [Planctomycetota bacterium]
MNICQPKHRISREPDSARPLHQPTYDTSHCVPCATWQLALLTVTLAWTTCLLELPALGQPSGLQAGNASLFGLNRVVDIHFELAEPEWETIQPAVELDGLSIAKAVGLMSVGAASGGNFRSEKSARPGLAGYLGVDHQYGRATVTIDGQTVRDVGLRYKGNGTFLAAYDSRKFSLKIDFHEFQDDVEFRGLTKINLHNNITDPAFLREPLAYALFREAGIHCSRVGFAQVSLTVAGTIDQKPMGLYTLVEQVDKRFLKDRYGSAEGLLLKPSTFGVFRYLGEDWAKYEAAYVPKTTASTEQQQRVIEFARLLHQSDDQTFGAQLEAYLDVDQFLRFLAVNVLLSNLDSFLGATQNYYIYLEPQTNRFQFFPWDLDISFGTFSRDNASRQQLADLSIDYPGGTKHTLIMRVLANARHRQTYHAYLARYLDTLFAEQKLGQQIDQLAAFVENLQVPAEDDPESATDVEPYHSTPRHLKQFVQQRHQSVQRQLAGESRGKIFGPAPISTAAVIYTSSLLVSVCGLIYFIMWQLDRRKQRIRAAAAVINQPSAEHSGT